MTKLAIEFSDSEHILNLARQAICEMWKKCSLVKIYRKKHKRGNFAVYCEELPCYWFCDFFYLRFKSKMFVKIAINKNTFRTQPNIYERVFLEKRDALRDLVPLVHFKKREKHPWRNVTFSKVKTSSWVFFTFFKFYKWSQIV